jgi:predicted AAA+ superfamily ATPase
VNRTRRLIKSPKAYWSDTGLALFLAGEPEPGGAHLENLVLTDLVVWRDAQVVPPEVLYWRTASGQEVDFVVEHEGELLAVEVKATARPSPRDAAHLRVLREGYGNSVRGALLLHTGSETFWITEGVLATPWWRVL